LDFRKYNLPYHMYRVQMYVITSINAAVGEGVDYVGGVLRV